MVTAQSIVEERMPVAPASGARTGKTARRYALLKTLVVMLVAMWVGG